MLCAPAVLAMLAVTAYPIGYAIVLSLQNIDLRFPDESGFVGLDNYGTVLSSELWWTDVFNTVFMMVISVAIELVLGMAIALVMHRAIFGRGVVRTSVLIPYGIITVVAAFAWQFAFAPDTGFVNHLPLIADDMDWFGGRFSSFAVIILAEVWKTTPFMALLLLAGLVTIDERLYEAAKVDGASAWQRFTRITLPLMKPAILVALLFRTLDALPRLRHDLHHDPRCAGHRIGLDPRLQPADLAAQPRPRLGGLGADLPLRLPDRVPLRPGLRRRKLDEGRPGG